MKKYLILIIAACSLFVAQSCKEVSNQMDPDYPADYDVNYALREVLEIDPVNVNGIDVMPYFDWRMFLTIFGIRYSGPVPDTDEVRQLEKDGKAVLDSIITEQDCRIMLAARFFDACSRDDGICFDGHCLPMFRKESATGNAGPLSLCDFVPPESSGRKGCFGMFAISVHETGPQCNCDSTDYPQLVRRAVRLTLAEAASLWLDRYLEERLAEGHRNNKDDSASDRIKIIKPAAGYASCPDHTLKKDILDLLYGGERLGIRLTESYAMIPDASICGMVFIHPEACYPEIRRISRRQFEDYCRRRAIDRTEGRMLLGHYLEDSQ